MTLQCYTNVIIIITIIIFLPSVAYEPEGFQKLDRIQKKTTKLAGMTRHLINKAVMKKNCVEALNQHAEPLEKKATFARFTWNLGNPSTKMTEKQNSWSINRAECFHRNWLKNVTTFQRSVLGCLASCCKLSNRACILRRRMYYYFLYTVCRLEKISTDK